MSDAHKAVFLSYAREDADAAKRIAEALRGFGVEVWFDQSELRGGDQWDARIRGQIKTCTLFIPIISATTQARDEAYFRLEWKLADDRSQLMAPGKPFIVPVVIDQTPETGATVPESFARAQWTRLDGGEPSTGFIEQVKRLLEGPKKPALKPDLPRPPTLPPEFRQAAQARAEAAVAAAAAKKSGGPRWIWIGAALVVAAVAASIFISRKPEPADAPVQIAAPDPKPQPVPRSLGEGGTPDPSRPSPPDAKSIAVLPFANMSAEKENEFFADGMHDDLITALAKVRDLKVISRTSTLAYRDAAARNLRKIAAELGVATVLEGSVQRVSNRVRINLQLIDARTDAHLWAETYNRELNDIFAIQAELVQQVAGALKATLTAGEQNLLARRPTESQAAYDLYLRARLLGQSLGLGADKEAYEAVIALYEQAAAADPKFALPHVQASILHGTMYWFGGLDSTPARRARVEAELAIAQRLAPDAPETYLARGSYEYTCRNDWARSLVEYGKAEAGLPNDAQLLYRIGIAHRRLGQMAEAQRRFEMAIGLNPSDLTGVLTYYEGLLDLRRYRRVVDEIDRAVAIFPTNRRLLTARIRARYELDGDRATYLRDIAAVPPDPNDSHGLNEAFAEAMRVGDLAAAERLLEDPRMLPTLGAGGALNYPVTLTRARVAWLRGRPEDARRLAEDATAYFRAGQWTFRQEPAAQMGVAYAHAYAGRYAEAIREGKAALASQQVRDVYALRFLQNDYGQILIVCGRRDEALAELRLLMARDFGPPANDIRFNQVWSCLKDDPRFEEILKSAKPL